MDEPLYRYSVRYARENGEIPDWRDSYRANIRCRDGIDRKIAEDFDGWHLSDGCVPDLCREFGIDRVGWVLANTVQLADWDGRYRPSTREWADSFPIPDSPEDRRWEFQLHSHPEIVNGMTGLYRKFVQSLGLHDRNDCLEDSGVEDYTGKVLILNPDILKDEYKTGDYQYFLAESGFGCNPSSLGSKVFGQFLLDGEKTYFARSEFIGIADESRMPEWALEKLDEIRNDQPDEEQSMQ